VRRAEFAILMSSLFIIGGNIDNNTGLIFIGFIWLLMAIWAVAARMD